MTRCISICRFSQICIDHWKYVQLFISQYILKDISVVIFDARFRSCQTAREPVLKMFEVALNSFFKIRASELGPT